MIINLHEHLIKNPVIESELIEEDYLGEDKPIRIWTRRYYLRFYVKGKFKKVLIYVHNEDKKMATIEELEAWFMSLDSLTPKGDSPGEGYEMSFLHYYVSFKSYGDERQFYATLVYDEEDVITGVGASIIEALSRLQNIIDAEYTIKYYEK